MPAFGSFYPPMTMGASTITAASLRPRLCVSLFSSASPPTSLLFLRLPNPIFRPKRCSPISLSLAADSSSSSAPPVGRNVLDMINVSWLIQYCSTFMVPEILNDAGQKVTSPGIIGQNDLLIVGPGVLGRMVAEKWRKDAPLVPIGRSPRIDILLSAEKEVLDVGGCVLRLAGLYISFLILYNFFLGVRFRSCSEIRVSCRMKLIPP
ncbi:hypothetical protein BHM03_00018296 [Ensete ventricosum]|nr:hypothetical protein BHM03_00018296 [Ensete ventricosum]